MVTRDCPTELSELLSNAHGRQRREERDIQKIDLQRARRYGIVEPARRGRLKYTYGGIIFIYDPKKRMEVTSFPSRDVALETSGTKVALPIILKTKEEYKSRFSLRRYDQMRSQVISDPNSWTSHSVLVIDMSGSMRRDDVSGAKCRSDGVWMTLARDYVEKPLKNKTRTHTDLLSIIVMKDDATVLLSYEMISWVLYNKLIALREWTALRPSGAGNYLPALEKADSLLEANDFAKCSLSLLFFSDGRPSDHGNFSEKMGQIASRFGRRLSVVCIGMADIGEDFSTLSDMVSEAGSYGAVASFGKPTLNADSLSNIISSLASSLTASKTELTNIQNGSARKVKTNITRERKDTPDDDALTDEWIVYKTKDKFNYVENIWTWSYKDDRFIPIFDTRCRSCYEITPHQCPYCRACSFCPGCTSKTEFYNHIDSVYNNGRTQCQLFQIERIHGNISDKIVPSWNVALKQPIFGEGAERIVHKFRFLDQGDNFFGPIMVAKESRFVDESEGEYKKLRDYHEDFMRTQAIAAECANGFNDALKKISSTTHKSNQRLPTIEFLEPMIVQASKKGNLQINILIEPMLEGKYEKFNDNMGMVKDLHPQVKMDDDDDDDINGLCDDFADLDVIEEGDEDEYSSDDEELFEKAETMPGIDWSHLQPELFPQAFSHFSYQMSKKNLIVVDLQGVLEKKLNGELVYKLTDPAIHQRKKKKKNRFRTWKFGRTDRGNKGIKAFFKSHKCNDVCRVLGLEEEHL